MYVHFLGEKVYQISIHFLENPNPDLLKIQDYHTLKKKIQIKKIKKFVV